MSLENDYYVIWYDYFKIIYNLICISDIGVKLEVHDMPTDECTEMIEIRLPTRMNFPNIRILDQSMGSLVIWTRMSTTVFRTKDVFLTAIEQVFKELFSKSPADIIRAVDVTIDVTIEDDTTAGKGIQFIIFCFHFEHYELKIISDVF